MDGYLDLEHIVTCRFCAAYNGEECELHDPPMPRHHAGSCGEWELTDFDEDEHDYLG